VKEPQPLANDTIIPIADASEVPRYTVHSPVTIKEPPKVAPRRSPSLGEHNDHVLEELGFSSAQIESLRANGATSKDAWRGRIRPAATPTASQMRNTENS
jgi:formyl-CoA transferase